MADPRPIESTGVVETELGVQYLINGKRALREDFNALTLARIAAALEAQVALMASDEEEAVDGEGDETKPSTPDNLFGV
jgi:hypothetical protein